MTFVPVWPTLYGNATGQDGRAGGGVPYDPPGEDSRKGAPTGTGSDDGAGPLTRLRATQTIVLGSVPHHFPIHVMSADRGLWDGLVPGVSTTHADGIGPADLSGDPCPVRLAGLAASFG